MRLVTDCPSWRPIKRMKRLVLALSIPACLAAQPISFGVKMGVPVSDAFDIVQSRNLFTPDTHRYTIGPTVELHLPFRLGIEVDALYRSFAYRSVFSDPVSGATVNTNVSSGAWEFPILAKYRLSGGLIRPYVLGGLSFNRLAGVSQVIGCVAGDCSKLPFSIGSTDNPADLSHRTNFGVVLGGGLELKIVNLRISPEIRYTRWGFANFESASGLLKSNQNQAAVLVGVTF